MKDILLILGAILVVVYLLFNVMHWPYQSYIRIAAFGLILISFVLRYFNTKKKKSSDLLDQDDFNDV